MAEPLGIGVIGARSMVAERAVLPGIVGSDRLRLVATASLGGPVRAPWDSVSVDSYEEVIGHPDVKAVYIPLPNGLHAHWAQRCAEAGKAVLCEKPIARNAAEAEQMATTARDKGTLLYEAWMTPFDARWSAAVEIARSGQLGSVDQVKTQFTFTIGAEASDNYRWDPDQGGGALLDVGIYCLGPAVALWGPDPASITASRTNSHRGVDETTTAELTWPGGQRASIRCSFVEEERQHLQIVGSEASLEIDGDAHTGGADPSLIHFSNVDGSSRMLSTPVTNPYATMLESFADAVQGVAEWPRPLDDSIRMLDLLDRIRQQTAG